MYKVLKNGKDVSRFHNQFAAIRHGDYDEFLNLVGDEIDVIVAFTGGKINTDTNIRNDDVDFGRLLKVSASMKSFYRGCVDEFGQFKDSDIPDVVFEELATFELALRMHRNNNLPRRSHIELETIIKEIKELKELSEGEEETLHNGRRFLNCVKRPEKMKKPWEQGISEFKEAYAVLKFNGLLII
jgi:hypothetical protein